MIKLEELSFGGFVFLKDFHQVGQGPMQSFCILHCSVFSILEIYYALKFYFHPICDAGRDKMDTEIFFICCITLQVPGLAWVESD